jgi:hypothetical protein
MLVPINHWVLITLYPSEKRAVHFSTLRSDESAAQLHIITTRIIDYICPYDDLKDWMLLEDEHSRQELHEMDANHCAVYVIVIAPYVAVNPLVASIKIPAPIDAIFWRHDTRHIHTSSNIFLRLHCKSDVEIFNAR